MYRTTTAPGNAKNTGKHWRIASIQKSEPGLQTDVELKFEMYPSKQALTLKCPKGAVP